MIRLEPATLTEYAAFGHLTIPLTWIFVFSLQVLVFVSIHGPSVRAPPTAPKLVTHEST